MSNIILVILLFLCQVECRMNNEISDFSAENSNQTIEIGISDTYSIEYRKETSFTFNIKDNSTYQINIHSINCNFKLDFNGEILNQINLNSYSLKMNETNKNITIKPLINKRDGIEKENYEQKRCYLSINSLNLNNPEIKIENKEDSFFYFKDYDKLKISYEINKIDTTREQYKFEDFLSYYADYYYAYNGYI